MESHRPTALIADDEPLLRRAIIQELAEVWPSLIVIAQAKSGTDAILKYEEYRPDICFLDIHMPGASGIEVARHIDGRAYVVFITAFDSYALAAFEQGALDYLVKPLDTKRLIETVSRLKDRLNSKMHVENIQELLNELASKLNADSEPKRLKWIHAKSGQALKIISVEDIDYLRADDKYTRVVWTEQTGDTSEALINSSLLRLLPQLDGAQFLQVHRSVVVNLKKVSYFKRNENETGTLYLKGIDERLPVSRGYLSKFKQM